MLDYATLDAGQTIGGTTVILDWARSSDSTSGVAGYSWVLSSSATPRTALDNIVDGTDLYCARALSKSGSQYLWLAGGG